eukprot:scaffold33394_cov62-Attheya_sp.AAC.6
MRWNPTQNGFEGLNIHYPKDVIVIDARQCSGISPKDFQDRRKVKENHMKYRKLHPGNRLSSVTSPMISPSETSFPDIPLLFRGRSNEWGECLWASSALLIHSMDKFAGISMMHYYNNNPDCFEWLSMYTGRGTKRNPTLLVEGGCKTDGGLSSLLTINTDFNLHKIRGKNGAIGNLEYVKQVGSENLMFFHFQRITLIGVVVNYRHVYLFRTWGKLDTKEGWEIEQPHLDLQVVVERCNVGSWLYY